MPDTLPQPLAGGLAPDAIARLRAAISPHISATRLSDNLHAIHTSDRQSHFGAFVRTAEFVMQVLRSAGIRTVERLDMKADGRTTYGDWVMPQAWEPSAAWLDISGPTGSERCADRALVPDSLIMQSAPTPPGGLHADLVAWDPALVPVPGPRMAFTTMHAQHIKGKAAAAGLAGLVSSFHPMADEDPASTFWYNCWSDRPSGWYATASDAKLFGFSLPPALGERIEQRLKNGEPLRAHAFVEARFSDAPLPLVNAVIEGDDPSREMLFFAHLYERGAHDNGSGNTTLLETACAIQEAIASGNLPRPPYSLRFVWGQECYGLMALAQERPDIVRRTVAGFALDGVGGGRPIRVISEPPNTDAGLAARFAEVAMQVWTKDEIVTVPFELSDTLINDPTIGIPTIWPHAACSRRTWHTTLDTPEVIDWETMTSMVEAVVAFVYSLPPGMPPAKQAVTCAANSRDKDVAEADEGILMSQIPQRTCVGPLSLDGIPTTAWPSYIKGSPRWFGWETQALWLADGKRTLREIAGLQPKSQHIPEYFRFLARHGLIGFRSTSVA